MLRVASNALPILRPAKYQQYSFIFAIFVSLIRAARAIANCSCSFLINRPRVFTVHSTRVVPREVAGIRRSSPLANAEQIGGNDWRRGSLREKRMSESVQCLEMITGLARGLVIVVFGAKLLADAQSHCARRDVRVSRRAAALTSPIA